jgi:chemotaxis protein MotB
MTFADLMTLLLCFFVLMLSFSEMDVAKFKQLMGSLQDAFGVQTDIEANAIPKGTSVVAQEFSPGRPDPTAMETVRQFTTNSNQNTLDTGRDKTIIEWNKLAQEQAKQLENALIKEIEEGNLSVRLEGSHVIVQILERGSFASGSADLEMECLPILDHLGGLLNLMKGAISVSGHTDNIPIRTSQYRSNWDLSSARAATVAHELLKTGINPERLMISGHADTQPRAPNDNSRNRALNRRIEITVFTERERHSTWIEETDDDTPKS